MASVPPQLRLKFCWQPRKIANSSEAERDATSAFAMPEGAPETPDCLLGPRKSAWARPPSVRHKQSSDRSREACPEKSAFAEGDVSVARSQFFAGCKKQRHAGEKRNRRGDCPRQPAKRRAAGSFRPRRSEVRRFVRDPREFQPHIVRTLETILWILRQACIHHTLKCRRHQRVERANRDTDLFRGSHWPS